MIMTHKIVLMKDVTQMYGRKKLKVPEIRVWVHPAKGGDDYWYVFKTLKGASNWSKLNQNNPKYTRVETPLVAYAGYEMSVSGFRKKYPKVKLV